MALQYYVSKLRKKENVTWSLMTTEELLVITNIFSGLLFGISELLSMSTCEHNGVLNYFFSKFSCVVTKNEDGEMENIIVVRDSMLTEN